MNIKLIIPPILSALVLAGCVSTTLPPAEGEHRAAVTHLKEAAKTSLSTEQRAVLYLDSAREAADLFDSEISGEPVRVIYNKAAADLAILLRSSENGRLWNQTQTLSSDGVSYRLRFAKGTRDGVWDSAYFTSFIPAGDVQLKEIKHRNHQDGVGGPLVGIRKTDPLELFSTPIGVTAPVTVVLDFKGRDVTLSLIDPSKKAAARVGSRTRTMEADFSAPLALYRHKWEFKEGVLGAMHGSKYMSTTGLYMLQPYDPDRIPLIFVHGLISTPRKWRTVINQIESDPTLRGRYQCWVFAYPTGNPPTYSALRFREELAKFAKLHPRARDYVLVGHSMGGLLTHMQMTTLTRESWDLIGKEKAARFFKDVKKGSLVERVAIFDANPRVDRAVFICTPHRGSKMAKGRIGSLGNRLITLPGNIADAVNENVGNAIAVSTGNPNQLPNSVTGLSPDHPVYKQLDAHPMAAPHHSIIGDRGKGDSPNSSDGVVEYWSSHLDTAKSECIVPGSHGACEMPETIAELRRILKLHLKENTS